MNRLSRSSFLCAGLVLFSLASCSRNPEPISENRYMLPDKFYQTLEANIRSNSEFEVIANIDHSRLAAKAGSPMPPAHVLIWSDPKLEAAILERVPLAAMDLPLRVLAFEDQNSSEAAVIANGFDYLVNRYSLTDDDVLRARYEASIASAMKGIPGEAIARFATDAMPDAGLVTLDSPHDFATTEELIMAAINSQSDAVNFGKVDFAQRARKYGVILQPMRLIMFGAPGPGGKAMASAPTLGLDAFCQKLLIWQDESGSAHVTFNDLLALAERQQVSGGIALRVINRRLRNTFSEALKD